MKNVKQFYVECSIDVSKVVKTIGTDLIVHETKGLLFWYDRYSLLKNQDSKVDRTLIDGKWYKYVDSVKCIDLRPTKQKQLVEKTVYRSRLSYDVVKLTQ